MYIFYMYIHWLLNISGVGVGVGGPSCCKLRDVPEIFGEERGLTVSREVEVDDRTRTETKTNMSTWCLSPWEPLTQRRGFVT